MNAWKLALVGLATLSTSAFAVPVATGTATAIGTSAALVSVPDLGGDEVVIVTDKVTGAISAQAPDGTLVPTEETTAAQVQKACYGGPCGLVYGPGSGYLGYEGVPVAPPVVVEETEVVKIRRFRRRVVPGYGAPIAPPYGAYEPGPGYAPEYGPGYGPGY